MTMKRKRNSTKMDQTRADKVRAVEDADSQEDRSSRALSTGADHPIHAARQRLKVVGQVEQLQESIPWPPVLDMQTKTVCIVQAKKSKVNTKAEVQKVDPNVISSDLSLLGRSKSESKEGKDSGNAMSSKEPGTLRIVDATAQYLRELKPAVTAAESPENDNRDPKGLLAGKRVQQSQGSSSKVANPKLTSASDNTACKKLVVVIEKRVHASATAKMVSSLKEHPKSLAAATKLTAAPKATRVKSLRTTKRRQSSVTKHVVPRNKGNKARSFNTSVTNKQSPLQSSGTPPSPATKAGCVQVVCPDTVELETPFLVTLPRMTNQVLLRPHPSKLPGKSKSPKTRAQSTLQGSMSHSAVNNTKSSHKTSPNVESVLEQALKVSQLDANWLFSIEFFFHADTNKLLNKFCV